jgi:hypothetical protein
MAVCRLTGLQAVAWHGAEFGPPPAQGVDWRPHDVAVQHLDVGSLHTALYMLRGCGAAARIKVLHLTLSTWATSITAGFMHPLAMLPNLEVGPPS